MMRGGLAALVMLMLCGAVLAQSKDSVVVDPAPAARRERVVRPHPMIGLLNQLAGGWKIQATLWRNGEDQPPVQVEGTGQWQMTKDQRYLMLEDTLVLPRETTWMGRSHMGFDDARNVLTLAAGKVDEQPVTATGTVDDSMRVFTFEGWGHGPDLPAQPASRRAVLRMITGNHRVLEIFARAGGREYKIAEIEYRRTR